MSMTTIQTDDRQQGVAFLRMLRLLSNEEQRIAYAVLEGMKIQQALDDKTKEGRTGDGVQEVKKYL